MIQLYSRFPNLDPVGRMPIVCDLTEQKYNILSQTGDHIPPITGI